MAPTYSDIAFGEFSDQMNKLIAQMSKLVDQITENLNKLAKHLWSIMRNALKLAWSKFCGMMNKVSEILSKAFSIPGSPDKISSIANSWSNLIGSPVSGKRADITVDNLATDDKWKGNAAEQYRQILPSQQNALGAIQSALSDPVSKALNDMQSAIHWYWGELIAATIAFVPLLMGAAASTLTVVGLPPGVLAAVAALAVYCAALYATVARLKSNTAGVNTKIRVALSANQYFPDSHWPSATKYLPGTEGPPKVAG
jgi:hypothetical protein